MSIKDNVNKVMGGRQLSSLVTVRNSLLAVVTFLTLIILAFEINNAMTALSERGASNRFVNVNRFSDAVLDLTQAVGNERALSRTALGSSSPVNNAVKQKVLEVRNRIDGIWSRIDSSLENVPDYGGKAEVIRTFRDSTDAYMQARAAFDTASSIVSDARAEGVSATIADSQQALMDAAQKLRITTERNFPSTDPELNAKRQLKNLLAIMMVQSSEEWGGLGSALASGNEISFQLAVQLPVVYGRALGAWDQAKDLLNSDLITSDLNAEVDAINLAYVDDFTISKDDLYAASEEGEDYPYTQIEWINLSMDATNTMAALSDAVTQEMAEVADARQAEATSSFITALLLLVVVLAIAALSYWWVIFKIVRPINTLSDNMIRLSEGDNDVEITGAERQDEIGKMAQCVQVFRDNAIEKIRLEEEQKEAEERRLQVEREEEEARRLKEEQDRIKEEERQEQARQERREEMLRLAASFEESVMGVVDGLSNSASGMESAAKELAQIAEDTSSKSSFVSKTSEQASHGIEMVATATEELSASIREISSQMNESSNNSREAVAQTSSAADEIRSLESQAEQVGNIVNQISEIAEQTNLLALNATIEAARAGEAGRGFAVVASEVKALATQTATATEDISRQIQTMQSATKQAVEAIGTIQGQISHIGDNAITMAASVEQQDASTQEIARNITDVSAGTQEVSSSIRDVNEGAVTTGSAASEVLASAQALTQQSSTLRKEVENFLETIRKE